MSKRLIFQAKWKIVRPEAITAWRSICGNEHMSIDSLLEKQEDARRQLVAHAFQNSPFYRKLYSRAGLDLCDIGMDGWFEKLPVVTKRHLREYFEEFIDPLQRQFMKTSTTGGSTGTPTKTGYDSRIPEEVYSWRLQRWFGVNPWDDHAYVWRDTRSSKIAKLKNALKTLHANKILKIYELY